MNPATHFLASWFAADYSGFGRRDRILITLSGVLPDLDGLGAVPDTMNRLLGNPQTYYYSAFHHTLLHGLPAALLLPLLTVWAAKKRLRTWSMGVVAVHIHMLLDLVGSRGPRPADVWPVSYLAPFSERMTLSLSWQWQLNAWPNILFTVVLLLMVFRSAITKGYTPIEMLGQREETVFIQDVRHRWEQIRKILPNQAL